MGKDLQTERPVEVMTLFGGQRVEGLRGCAGVALQHSVPVSLQSGYLLLVAAERLQLPLS